MGLMDAFRLGSQLLRAVQAGNKEAQGQLAGIVAQAAAEVPEAQHTMAVLKVVAAQAQDRAAAAIGAAFRMLQVDRPVALARAMAQRPRPSFPMGRKVAVPGGPVAPVKPLAARTSKPTVRLPGLPRLSNAYKVTPRTAASRSVSASSRRPWHRPGSTTAPTPPTVPSPMDSSPTVPSAASAPSPYTAQTVASPMDTAPTVETTVSPAGNQAETVVGWAYVEYDADERIGPGSLGNSGEHGGANEADDWK